MATFYEKEHSTHDRLFIFCDGIDIPNLGYVPLGNLPLFSKKLSNLSELIQFFGEPLEKLEKLSPISELPLHKELYFQHVFNFQQRRLG
jgi:hypothetical protein